QQSSQSALHPLTHISMFFSSGCGHHQHLHSFPTRRSSDLSSSTSGRSHPALQACSPWHSTPVRSRTVRGPRAASPIFASVLASRDRKSTRLNSSHLGNSYAVFCLKKKRKRVERHGHGRDEH